MSFLDQGHAYTNASLRKLLGESGYIQVSGPARTTDSTSSWTMWERGADRIWLVERQNASPELRVNSRESPIIDPKTLGVRNANIQNDGSPDE